MTEETYRTYRGTFRGALKAAMGGKGALYLVSVHPEGHDSEVYRLDTEKFSLRSGKLPCGGTALVVDSTVVWVGGDNGQVYRFGADDMQSAVLKHEFNNPVLSLALLSSDRLAALADRQIAILSRSTGALLQTLELSEAGSTMAADRTGQWLAAGTSRGHVAVFESETTPEFATSETGKLHEGAVIAILFEPEELRFFSAGADQKVLLTHARGRLEPEDKARANNHKDAVTALILGPGGRFYSGSRDGTIKNWPRAGFKKPSTTDDGVGKTVDLAAITIKNKQHLVAVCEDDSLRMFPIDESGELGNLAFKILDVYALANHQFTQKETTRRENALQRLAKFNDSRSIEMIAKRVDDDEDHELRLLATKLLSESGHPLGARKLEKNLKHRDASVRMAALEGLRNLLGANELRPLNLALKAKQKNIGTTAIKVLQQLAQSDDQALSLLAAATNSEPFEVRRAALLSLEHVHGDDSPEGDLVGLESEHSDVRRLALIRLHQRGLLQLAPAQSAIRLSCEDKDADVRRTAMLLSLMVSRMLFYALRARDNELHRQIHELETFRIDATEQLRTKDAELPSPPPVTEIEFGPSDLEPLLQAMASRAVDTCLTGAKYLALLGDTRAFGVLLQLSREEDAKVRREVCRSLAALQDPRAAKRLRGLLHDSAPEVRDAAFTALAQILASNPLEVAEAGLAAASEDTRRRGLQALIEQLRQSSTTTDDPALQLLVRALNDSIPGVRSEAFKACLNLKIGGGDADTLQFILQSVHADMRREVLTEVMAQFREDWAWQLLLEFFDDSDQKLRGESFEYALEKAKETDIRPLERAVSSQYADIRLAATKEIEKRHTEDAQALLVKVLEDDDRQVRQKALDALVSVDAKDALTLAMTSSHLDVRLRAATARARHGDTATLQPLIDLATSKEPEQGEAKEKVELWRSVVQTALAGLAELGDPAALDHVIGLLDNEQASIRKAVGQALVWLTRPETLDKIKPQLQHADAQVRFYTALACCFCGDLTAVSLLFTERQEQYAGSDRSLLEALGASKGGALAERIVAIERRVADHPNENPEEVHKATVSRISAPLPFVQKVMDTIRARESQISSTGPHFDSNIGTPEERLIAAFVLDDVGEDYLIAFLDSDDEQLRNMALILLLVWDLKRSDGIPARCLACLSSRAPRVRLSAASALERFSDSQEFLWQIVGIVNDKGEEKPWEITEQTVDSFADLVVNREPHIRARTAYLLRLLGEEKQSAWDQAWSDHQYRYGQRVADAKSKSEQTPTIPPSYSQLQLQQLAFGAYVGLVREQGGYHERGRRSSLGAAVIRVRQTALNRLMALAHVDGQFLISAQSVFVQALGDPNQDVRLQAFKQLKALGMDTSDLGAEALRVGHTDLGVEGLELLIADSDQQHTQSVLEQAMLSRTDELAIEAAKLLMEHTSKVAVATRGLNASFGKLRSQSVRWLAEVCDQDEAAKSALREALNSGYRVVRTGAAIELAKKKDTFAFEALVELLKAQDEKAQKRVVRALEQISDPRAPDALIDRVENDPSGTAMVSELLKTAGKYRQPQNADRLFKLMRNEKLRNAAFHAIRMISGYDQIIKYHSDELPDDYWQFEELYDVLSASMNYREQGNVDTDWQRKQHPRYDDILARLLDQCFALGDNMLLMGIMESARWSVGNDVNPMLATLASGPDESLRNGAVESIGWRVRHRSGPVDPLLKCLEHRDPTTKFLAAEQLAKAGRADGLTILLSGVDLMSDVRARMRAVAALGELADERALDMLLKLASEDSHALQETAAEAIGHLAKSSKADEILALLQRYAKRNDGLAEQAWRGLRWFDTEAGWKIIRERAVDSGCWFREMAFDLLGYNDNSATRDVLLKAIRSDEEYLLANALSSARRLFGEDSLEPDYSLLQNTEYYFDEDDDEDRNVLERVSQRGEPSRIFETLPNASKSIRQLLIASLLKLDTPPLSEAIANVENLDPVSAEVAAHILGRAEIGAVKAGPALEKAIDHWRNQWRGHRQKMIRQNQTSSDELDRITTCLTRMMWAAGRLSVARQTLLATAERVDDPKYTPIRLAALAALCDGNVDAAVTSVLEAAAIDQEGEVRTFAITALSRFNSARATDMAEDILSDRVSFNRLVGQISDEVDEVLHSTVARAHYQAVALPHLIVRGDVQSLAAVVVDGKLPDNTRLGAIEGLASLAREEAEAKLIALGETEEDEELRRAAWRGVRRSKRARQKNG